MSQARESYHHGNLRSALIEAGLHLTRAGGPSALVLRDVTRRVGVSPNAAYRHFADRDALLRAVADEILAGMAAEMLRADPDGPGAPVRAARPGPKGRVRGGVPLGATDAAAARSALRAVGLGYIGFALSEPGWFQTAFTTNPDVNALRAPVEHGPGPEGTHGPVVALGPGAAEPGPHLPAPLAMLVGALDALEATGALAPERRAGAEWPCWSAVHGFALLALHGPLHGQPRADVWAAAERTVDVAIAGVLADDDAS